MADIINLRRHRKNKKRTEKEVVADKNRKRFGTSTKLKKISSANNDIEARKLDGSRLSTDE